MIKGNPENEKRANEMHESRAAPRSEFWFFLKLYFKILIQKSKFWFKSVFEKQHKPGQQYDRDHVFLVRSNAFHHLDLFQQV